MYAIRWHVRFPYNGIVASKPRLSAAFSTTPTLQRNSKGKRWSSWDEINNQKQERQPKQDRKSNNIPNMVPPPGVDLLAEVMRIPPPTGSPMLDHRSAVPGEKRYQSFFNPLIHDFPRESSAKKPLGSNVKNAKVSKRDAKIQPSQKSGGIPSPTQQYLVTAAEQVIRREQPQNLLLVIDLNGTLLYRPDRKQPTKFIPRPNAELFLTYCIETFHVVIWSSAREENVGPMVTTLLTPKLREKVIQIWARRKFNLSPADFDRRVICYKRLETVWKDPKVALSHPERAYGRCWDQTNTVLIDDTAEKAKAEPYNIIEVPEWSGDMRDNILPVVHDFLNNLSLHTNVSAFLRTNPFTSHLQEMQLRASEGEARRRAGLPL